MKVLSIEYNDMNKTKRIENVWWCSLDQATNELRYNTCDDTMNMKTLSVEDVDRVTLYNEEKTEPNTTHMEDLFTWYKDFEKHFRKWED